MTRPRRTVRRESVVTVPHSRSKRYPEGRPLVLLVPPTADVLVVREKGRVTAYEVDVLTLYHVGAKLAAERRRAERKAKRTTR